LLRRKKPLTRKTPLRARKTAVPALRATTDRIDPRIEAARKVWRLLEGRTLAGLSFDAGGPTGPFAADFVCLAARLVVLLGNDDPQAGAWFEAQGYRVLAFDAADACRNPQGVLDAIADSFRLRVIKR
jgi:very-short-patch-repair endonuclease